MQNVTPEPACSCHLLSTKEDQKGLFLPDSDCSHPLKIPLEIPSRKDQEVSVLVSKVGGLILGTNNLGRAQACALKPHAPTSVLSQCDCIYFLLLPCQRKFHWASLVWGKQSPLRKALSGSTNKALAAASFLLAHVDGGGAKNHILFVISSYFLVILKATVFTFCSCSGHSWVNCTGVAEGLWRVLICNPKPFLRCISHFLMAFVVHERGFRDLILWPFYKARQKDKQS